MHQPDDQDAFQNECEAANLVGEQQSHSHERPFLRWVQLRSLIFHFDAAACRVSLATTCVCLLLVVSSIPRAAADGGIARQDHAHTNFRATLSPPLQSQPSPPAVCSPQMCQQPCWLTPGNLQRNGEVLQGCGGCGSEVPCSPASTGYEVAPEVLVDVKLCATVWRYLYFPTAPPTTDYHRSHDMLPLAPTQNGYPSIRGSLYALDPQNPLVGNRHRPGALQPWSKSEFCGRIGALYQEQKEQSQRRAEAGSAHTHRGDTELAFVGAAIREFGLDRVLVAASTECAEWPLKDGHHLGAFGVPLGALTPPLTPPPTHPPTPPPTPPPIPIFLHPLIRAFPHLPPPTHPDQPHSHARTPKASVQAYVRRCATGAISHRSCGCVCALRPSGMHFVLKNNISIWHLMQLFGPWHGRPVRTLLGGRAHVRFVETMVHGALTTVSYSAPDLSVLRMLTLLREWFGTQLVYGTCAYIERSKLELASSTRRRPIFRSAQSEWSLQPSCR